MNVYQLRAKHNGKLYPIKRYFDYTKREAIRLYKLEHNLTSKHNVKFTQY